MIMPTCFGVKLAATLLFSPEVSMLSRASQVQTDGPMFHLISPKTGEAEEGGREVIELKEVFDALHLVWVVIVLGKNLHVRIDMCFCRSSFHAEDSSKSNLFSF